MRKKHWAKDMIAQRTDCVIASPEEMKGRWKLLAGDREIRVEIGSGKGDYWIGMSHLYPDYLWVAIEKDESCVGITLKKCLENTTDNMKIINGDAAEIGNWFEENEIDVIHLNFSDPWPKKRHHLRRLSSHVFLEKYESIFKGEKVIEMRTDNSDLFQYSLVSFSTFGYVLEEIYFDLHKEKMPSITTEYEDKFSKDDLPIYFVRCLKP